MCSHLWRGCLLERGPRCHGCFDSRSKAHGRATGLNALGGLPWCSLHWAECKKRGETTGNCYLPGDFSRIRYGRRLPSQLNKGVSRERLDVTKQSMKEDRRQCLVDGLIYILLTCCGRSSGAKSANNRASMYCPLLHQILQDHCS